MIEMKQGAIIFVVALGLSLGNASTIRGARDLQDYQWPPSFLEAYKEAYPDKQFLCCKAFLTDKGITDPTTGTMCHKRVNMGPYSCFAGEQTCESDIVSSTLHPKKICDCDIETGLLTCDESWDPCKAPELLLDVQPQTHGMNFGPLDAELTPPPFGTELGDARPTFEGTWDGTLDLDTRLDDGIANDVRPDDGGGLTLPGDTPVQTERTFWAEWEGGKCLEAAAAIHQEPNVFEVECVELGAITTFEWNQNRVRIFYNPATPVDKIVVGIPMIG